LDFFRQLVDMVLHVDEHLHQVIQTYGTGTYLLLFVIVFCETGLVVTPFLPGDSLLFAVGAFAARGSLDLVLSMVVLAAAGILGDSVNYWIGARVGPAVFQRKDSRIFKQEYLERTRHFYEKYGAKTIVLARFVPIVRTFAPFVAGIGRMHYGTFLAYNVVGALVWVGLLVPAGYFFGNIPFVRANFEIAVLVIIVVSVLPVIVEFVKHRRAPVTPRVEDRSGPASSPDAG
jgi:membrane-associated protein